MKTNICSFQAIQSLLIFAFIALSPSQDCFLAGTPLRYIGGSPSFIPLVALVLMSLLRWLRYRAFRVNRRALFCGLYILIMTIYGLFAFGVSIYDHNLIAKSLISFVPIGLFLFAIFCVDYTSKALLRRATYTAFALLVLGFAFGSNSPFGLPPLVENPILHSTPSEELRPRGLCTEPSMLSASTICIGLLAAHFARSRAGRTSLILATVGMLALSQSKGGILTLLLCVVAYAFMRWHTRWYLMLTAICLAAPAVALVGWKLIPFFIRDDSAVAGTFATRFSMILCSVVIVAHHPFGVGLSGFLPAISRYAPVAIAFFDSLFGIPVLFGEILSSLATGEALDTKTFFFDQLIRFGIPFVIGYAIMLRKVTRGLLAMNETVLLFSVVAVVIATTTYVPPLGSYFCPIVLGTAYSAVKRTGEAAKRLRSDANSGELIG